VVAIGGFLLFLLTIAYVFLVDWGFVSVGLRALKQLADQNADVNALQKIADELQTISKAKSLFRDRHRIIRGD
jgi:ubiquinone biosynthesis protein Coq4